MASCCITCTTLTGKYVRMSPSQRATRGRRRAEPGLPRPGAPLAAACAVVTVVERPVQGRVDARVDAVPAASSSPPAEHQPPAPQPLTGAVGHDVTTREALGQPSIMAAAAGRERRSLLVEVVAAIRDHDAAAAAAVGGLPRPIAGARPAARRRRRCGAAAAGPSAKASAAQPGEPAVEPGRAARRRGRAARPLPCRGTPRPSRPAAGAGPGRGQRPGHAQARVVRARARAASSSSRVSRPASIPWRRRGAGRASVSRQRSRLRDRRPAARARRARASMRSRIATLRPVSSSSTPPPPGRPTQIRATMPAATSREPRPRRCRARRRSAGARTSGGSGRHQVGDVAVERGAVALSAAQHGGQSVAREVGEQALLGQRGERGEGGRVGSRSRGPARGGRGVDRGAPAARLDQRQRRAPGCHAAATSRGTSRVPGAALLRRAPRHAEQVEPVEQAAAAPGRSARAGRGRSPGVPACASGSQPQAALLSLQVALQRHHRAWPGGTSPSRSPTTSCRWIERERQVAALAEHRAGRLGQLVQAGQRAAAQRGQRFGEPDGVDDVRRRRRRGPRRAARRRPGSASARPGWPARANRWSYQPGESTPAP